jgi:hypothetical protein
MKNLNFIFDMDDTFVDFIGKTMGENVGHNIPFLKLVRRENYFAVDPESNIIEDYKNNGNFYQETFVNPAMTSYIIEKSNENIVKVVSASICNDSPIFKSKKKFLDDYLKNLEHHLVIGHHNKGQFISEEHTNIIFDDRLENFKDFIGNKNVLIFTNMCRYNSNFLFNYKGDSSNVVFLKQPLILSNKEDIQDIDNIITTFLRKGSK